jgi:hypothetical protein
MGTRVLVLGVISALVLGGLFVILRPDPPATEPAARSFDLEVGADGMSPGEVSVGEGDRVKLNFTSDRPVEVHLHGYDIEREAGADETTGVSFRADLTGRFPMEDHGTGEEIGVLVVGPR